MKALFRLVPFALFGLSCSAAPSPLVTPSSPEASAPPAAAAAAAAGAVTGAGAAGADGIPALEPKPTVEGHFVISVPKGAVRGSLDVFPTTKSGGVDYRYPLDAKGVDELKIYVHWEGGSSFKTLELAAAEVKRNEADHKAESRPVDGGFLFVVEPYPMIEELPDEKFETVYVLKDAPGRVGVRAACSGPSKYQARLVEICSSLKITP